MMKSPTLLLSLLLTISLTNLATAQTPDSKAPKQEPAAPAKDPAPVVAPAKPDSSAPVKDAGPTAAPATVPAAAPAPTGSALKPVSSPVAPRTKFSDAVTAVIGPQVEGKAKVVFFRPSKFAGAAIGFIVRERETELGKLRSGNYFVLNVEPGKHTYTVHSEAEDNSTHEMEAGETYFIAGSISMGFFAGHPHLTTSNVATFEAALPKLEPSKPLK
jgi:hypothetical protein